MIPQIFIPMYPVIAATVLVLHWVIVVGLGLRIILKRRPTGVSLSWFLVVASVPYFGALVYLMVGEVWIPKRRIRRYNAFKDSMAAQIEYIDQVWDIKGDALEPIARSLNALASKPLNISAIGGNSMKLFDTSTACFSSIVEDIDRAHSTVCMLFYLWDSKGEVRLVEEALIRAATRGVACRVMVDSAGNRKFARSKDAMAMRRAGVQVVETLPVGIFRMLFARIDIRNHRKIVTIDHDIGYTGSMNMVDPRFFHQMKGVGRWVDVMARVEGPGARVLDMTINLDWGIEMRDDPSGEIRSMTPSSPVEPSGEIPLQIVPSGPDQAPRIIHDMLLTLIYNATDRLIITTPYFIPGEAMLTALTGASMRGVRVTLVVPKKIDSILVRYASKSYFEDLLDAGVEICLYRGGLLHAKTVTADGEVALLGTVNMDKRSFWINFEISLFAYEQGIVAELRGLQESYIRDADRVEGAQWRQRPVLFRIAENSVQLLSPIL